MESSISSDEKAEMALVWFDSLRPSQQLWSC